MTDLRQPPSKKAAAQVGAVLVAAAIAAPLTLASEGLVTRTSADPVGIPTICWGHANAEPGKTYTLDNCQQIAVLDLAKAGAGIAPCIKVPVSDKTRAAFTDFAFNVGTGAFCTSTLAKKLNTGDVAGACAGLSAWVYAGGKPLPGLVTRRAAERALCEAGVAEGASEPSATAPEASQATAAPAPAKPTIWQRIKGWFA